MKDSAPLFSCVANKSQLDRGPFWTAQMKWKPNPKVYGHREYQLQGERAEAMKTLLKQFIARGWIEPSDTEWATQHLWCPRSRRANGG